MSATRPGWGIPRVAAISAIFLGSLIGLAFLSLLPEPVLASPVYFIRGPILIEGDSNFTTENGVVEGSGTSTNPFLIRRWAIEADGGAAIEIRNTTRPFVIEQVVVENGTYGVRLKSVTGGRLLSIWARDNVMAVAINASSEVRLESSILWGNTYGVDLAFSDGIVIANNSISFNRNFEPGTSSFGGVGLSLLSPSTNVAIEDNDIIANRDSGILLRGAFTNLAIRRNEITHHLGPGIGSGLASGLLLEENTFFSNAEGIRSIGGKDVAIIGNTLSDVFQGVSLIGVSEFTIRSNTFQHEAGVWVFGSTGLTLEGNHFDKGGISLRGLALAAFDSHTITPDNLIAGRPIRYHRACDGLNLDGLVTGQLIIADCRDVRVSGLNVSEAYVGVTLAYVERAEILANNASANLEAGISLLFVENSTVTRNHLVRNGNCGLELFESFAVQVVGNAFIGNPACHDGKGENSWDGGYPVGGNFWSDYGGKDECTGPSQDACPEPDGIGDTVYERGALVDGYPLMTPPTLEATTPPPTEETVTPPSPIFAVVIVIPLVATYLTGLAYLLRRKAS